MLSCFISRADTDFLIRRWRARRKAQFTSCWLDSLSNKRLWLVRSSSPYEHDGDGSSSATDPYANTPPTASVTNSDDRPDSAEVFALKKELELTRERMAQMELEVTQTRLAKHTVEEAIGSPFPSAQHLAFNLTGPIGPPPQNSFQGRASPFHPQGQVRPTPGTGLWIDTGLPSGSGLYTPQQ